MPQRVERRVALVEVHAVRETVLQRDRERERRRARPGADHGLHDAAGVQFGHERAGEREVGGTGFAVLVAGRHQGAPQSSGPSTVRSLSSVSVNSARGSERATMPAPAHAAA